MSEWLSVILVFWGLWLADGWKISPVARHHVAGGGRRARFSFARLSPWRVLPGGWQAQVADLPFALSPDGICNRPVGSAGRPADVPHTAQAWAWAEIREVQAKEGWLFVNGTRFCRDTGHLPAGRLLALAKLEPVVRAGKIDWWLQRWLRPAHLRRRARVLRRRTEAVATLNLGFLVVALFLGVHFTGYFGQGVPRGWDRLVERALPLLGAYVVFFHLAALGLAVRAFRKLKRVQAGKRGAGLFTAAMLPPQALRLRALAGDGWFPAQHPLAYALAFAGKPELAEMGFHALGDLRWPIDGKNDAPLAREICAWHREELAGLLRTKLEAAGVAVEELFATPAGDVSGGCLYCPRCRSQFTGEAPRCPHGVGLLSVIGRKK